MNLDAHQLPVTLDQPGNVPDTNDQLQRVGQIAVGEALTLVTLPMANPVVALETLLQPSYGIYTRYTGGPVDSTSADQLISALAAHTHLRNTKQVIAMMLRCAERLGFAQNYTDTLGGTNAFQIPDIMIFRAAPLFARVWIGFYPLAVLADLYLIIMAISAVLYSRQSLDSVDQNDTLLTLTVCSHRMPTPFSYVSRLIVKKYLATNYGVQQLGGVNNMDGAMKWYHRAPSGNPEIANLWTPICKELF